MNEINKINRFRELQFRANELGYDISSRQLDDLDTVAVEVSRMIDKANNA